MESVHKSPKLPKTIETLQSSADYDLGNIQNVTPKCIWLIHLCFIENIIHGDSSNVCTDNRFIQEEVLF